MRVSRVRAEPNWLLCQAPSMAGGGGGGGGGDPNERKEREYIHQKSFWKGSRILQETMLTRVGVGDKSNFSISIIFR